MAPGFTATGRLRGDRRDGTVTLEPVALGLTPDHSRRLRDRHPDFHVQGEMSGGSGRLGPVAPGSYELVVTVGGAVVASESLDVAGDVDLELAGP